MKLVYSISTQPNRLILKDKLDKQLLIWKKSINLAKRFYPITLWTDDIGANELGDLVDEVKILKKEGPNYLWCEPKYEAMSEEDASNSIFIDGDVFLSEPLKFTPDLDVWYEHFEIRTFDFGYKPKVEAFDDINIWSNFKYWNSDLKGACNVGILRFGTNEIMKEYRDAFYSLKDYYFRNVVQTKILDIPEMIMEEYALHCLIYGKDWKSEELSTQNQYIHLYGIEKYKDGFLQLMV